MNIGKLSRATAQILADYLPTLTAGERMPQETDPVRRSARAIWDELYPVIAEYPPARSATAQLAQQPNAANQGRLALQLERIFLRDAKLTRSVHASIAFGPYAPLLEESSPPEAAAPPPPAPVESPPPLPEAEPEPELGDMPPPPTAAPAPSESAFPPSAPGPTVGPAAEGLVPVRASACQVCGAQDDTVRSVTFPYVVSVAVLTYRLKFAGVWCRWHASLRWALAVFVTTLVGWLGIPFGLIYTPIVLFSLALGGEQPSDVNAALLRRLAQRKYAENDPAQTIRCMEAVLQFDDSEQAQLELASLYKRYGVVSPEGGVADAASFVSVMVVAWIVGLVVGVLDQMITIWITTPLFALWRSGYLVVLSWLPLVVMAFMAGMVLMRSLENVLAVTQTRRRPLAYTLAVAVSLLLAYGMLTGVTLGSAIPDLSRNPISLLGSILFLGMALTRGGVWSLAFAVEEGTLSNHIFLVVVGLLVVFYTAGAIGRAEAVVRWQQRLAAVRERSDVRGADTFILGWIAILCIAVAFAVALVLFSPLLWELIFSV